MTLSNLAKQNLSSLTNNPYPGRGIVLGLTPDEKNLVQVYWIMGRSENSRNRIFVEEANTFMRTKAFDESKLEDPSLIIYHPMKVVDNMHIVTNGDQTDTLESAFIKKDSFEAALKNREYEPDGPNFTPRISGFMDLNNPMHEYHLSILKSFHNTEATCQRFYYKYEKAQAGLGHCITTYMGDGNPLPSFTGEPYLLPLANSIEEVTQNYWNALNADNKVSLAVKFIDKDSGEAQLKIINKHS
jgi:hypothetical protein